MPKHFKMVTKWKLGSSAAAAELGECGLHLLGCLHLAFPYCVNNLVVWAQGFPRQCLNVRREGCREQNGLTFLLWRQFCNYLVNRRPTACTPEPISDPSTARIFLLLIRGKSTWRILLYSCQEPASIKPLAHLNPMSISRSPSSKIRHCSWRNCWAKLLVSRRSSKRPGVATKMWGELVSNILMSDLTFVPPTTAYRDLPHQDMTYSAAVQNWRY